MSAGHASGSSQPPESSGAVGAAPPPLRRLDAVESVYQVTLLTLRRTLRGKRMLWIAALLALPCILAWSVARGLDPERQERFFYETLVFYQFGIAVPSVALLMATAFPWPESDEGSLTYWFTAPVRRWTVHLGRTLASLAIGAIVLPVAVLALALPLDPGDSVELAGPVRTAVTATLLAFPAYLAVFSLLCTWLRRGLIGGVFLILVENSLSLVTGNLAKLTVVYYVRSILWPATSLLGRRVLENAARIDDPASSATAITVFVAVTIVALGIAMVLVEVLEYRGKHAQPG